MADNNYKVTARSLLLAQLDLFIHFLLPCPKTAGPVADNLVSDLGPHCLLRYVCTNTQGK